MKELQDYYLESKQIEAFESLKSDVLLEQFLAFLKPEIRSFVDARTPANAEEAAGYADLPNEIGGKNRTGYASRHQYSGGRENNVSKMVRQRL